MRLYVYSLGKTIYEGDSDSVTLPAEGGEVSVLPHHVPFVTALHKGNVISRSQENEQRLPIEKGFAYIDGSHLVVLAD